MESIWHICLEIKLVQFTDPLLDFYEAIQIISLNLAHNIPHYALWEAWWLLNTVLSTVDHLLVYRLLLVLDHLIVDAADARFRVWRASASFQWKELVAFPVVLDFMLEIMEFVVLMRWFNSDFNEKLSWDHLDASVIDLVHRDAFDLSLY